MSARKNAPRNTDSPSQWPANVWSTFQDALSSNLNSRGRKYFEEESVWSDLRDLPPALQNERCHNPVGAAAITVCINGHQYQRPLHRIRFLLYQKAHLTADEFQAWLTTNQQASHLCMDRVNLDGKGTTHCSNPNHMVAEDDKTNKLRQRCAGWIWIWNYDDHPGGYWYPSCTHTPPCLRFTPKSSVPTTIRCSGSISSCSSSSSSSASSSSRSDSVSSNEADELNNMDAFLDRLLS